MPQPIELNDTEHSIFLNANPHDPVTGDVLRAGDKVLACRKCKSVFLISSLIYLGFRHCEQSHFERKLPVSGHIKLESKMKKNHFEAAALEAVFFAWFIDNIIFGLIFIPFYLTLGYYFGSSIESALLGFVLLIPIYLLILMSRDAWFSGSSPGKYLADIKVISDKGKNCNISRALIRGFFSPLLIFTPLTEVLGKKSIFDRVTKTSTIKRSEQNNIKSS